MADPYLPPQVGGRPISSSVPKPLSSDPYYRDASSGDRSIRITNGTERTGMGAGLMVVVVFVVVVILAAVLYNRSYTSDVMVPASNDTVPAADAPAADLPATDVPATDAPATDAPVTDGATTDAPATEGGTITPDLAPTAPVTPAPAPQP